MAAEDGRRRAGEHGAEATGRVGFPRPGPSRFTFEGHLEALDDFTSGARRARGWRQAVALGLVALLLLPVIVFVVRFVLSLAAGL